MASPNVPKLYQGIIEDVISGVREAFLDEGVDEQILQELKQLWESKVNHHKALSSDGGRGHSSSSGISNQAPAMLMAVDGGGRHDRLHHPTLHHQRPSGSQQGQQLVYSLQSGPLDLARGIAGGRNVLVPAPMSGAATAAAMALPTAVFPYNGFTLQQTSQGQLIAVPTSALQMPLMQAQLEPQNLSKGKDSGQQVVQLDGCADDDGTSLTAGAADDNVAMALESHTTSSSSCCSMPCSEVNRAQRRQSGRKCCRAVTVVVQVDGPGGNSSSDDDDDDDDVRDGDDENADAAEDDDADGDGSNEDKPLNSDDDVDDGESDLFDTENVIVCQFDKINRSKSKWKFHLKDGIMNLKGRDYVFHKATGEADW